MKLFFRILFSLCLLFLAVGGPWWLWVLVALCGIFLFPLYIEVVVIAFLFDASFAPETFPWRGIFTAGALLCLFGIVSFKRMLRSDYV